jgi:REP element-mobilizing transposase RayT
MEKFNGKYRTTSHRLKGWDYSWDGAYFITIDTNRMMHFFGKVVNGEMQLSEIGKLADKFWAEIPLHFPHVTLGNFVVMPNHVHGVIIINDITNKWQKLRQLGANESQVNLNIQKSQEIEADDEESIRKYMSELAPKSGTVSTIVRSYKSVVTKHAREINPSFKWMVRFYGAIVTTEEGLFRVERYIKNNPKNWKW